MFFAAFLAGAVVQRLWLGHFGFKLGPLEVPEVPAVAADSKQAIEELRASFTAALEDLKEKVDEALANQARASELAMSTAAAAARAATELSTRLDTPRRGRAPAARRRALTDRRTIGGMTNDDLLKQVEDAEREMAVITKRQKEIREELSVSLARRKRELTARLRGPLSRLDRIARS